VGLRLTLGFLTIFSSKMSPFHYIGTLPLQRKQFPTRNTPSHTAVDLNGTHLSRTLVRKTFDTRTCTHVSRLSFHYFSKLRFPKRKKKLNLYLCGRSDNAATTKHTKKKLAFDIIGRSDINIRTLMEVCEL